MTTIQPPYLRTSEDWAKTLWGHLPENEFAANLEFMITIGDSLNGDGQWLYPDLGTMFIKDECSSDNEAIFWYVEAKKDREEFAVNFDGEHYFVLLESELAKLADGIPMEAIEIAESPNGPKGALVSIKALLAGYHPAACVHEYCLDNNLYSVN